MSETTNLYGTLEWLEFADGANASEGTQTIASNIHATRFGERMAPLGKRTVGLRLWPPARPLGGVTKRLLDIVVASGALLLALPLILIVAAAIKRPNQPVFFAHERVGYGGKAFLCFKFRTMVTNPEETLQHHLATDPSARAEWEERQKLERDPRVTRLGYVLRKTSIDELPQLLNVLRGEMSCVGPRPVTAEELDRYGANANLYLSTRPGLTGPWQISGRNRLGYSDRVELDSDYVTNWSFLRDVAIILRTAGALMRTSESS